MLRPGRALVYSYFGKLDARIENRESPRRTDNPCPMLQIDVHAEILKETT
jgi:hypothetical protein